MNPLESICLRSRYHLPAVPIVLYLLRAEEGLVDA